MDYVERHLDERAVAPPLVLFEVYHGEVFKAGVADFDAVDRALGWLTVVDETAELQNYSTVEERPSPPEMRTSPGPRTPSTRGSPWPAPISTSTSFESA